ncbi:helix-turn-helix domain-containing protein [Marinifilum fragile]|uniref:helix-turn-helix domain-containing protein n=1 Tax=Marinifilum fragile TaxID=570161 RepID=UPI002AA91034|nr:helix-turn-helix domain-containing protein [Marinifilum fragile]
MENNFFSNSIRNEIKHIIKESLRELLPLTKENTPQVDLKNDLLTQTEAADFLQISVTTLIKRRKQDKIPFYQDSKGSPVFYKKSELIKLFSNDE